MRRMIGGRLKNKGLDLEIVDENDEEAIKAMVEEIKMEEKIDREESLASQPDD